MTRTIALARPLATVILAALILSSAAWAGQIYVDDGTEIYNYIPPGVPPGTTQQNFAAYNGKVMGMAFGYTGSAPVLYTAASTGTPSTGKSGGTGAIFEYSQTGVQSTFTTSVGVTNPIGLAINQAGDVYTSETYNGNVGAEILEFQPNGTLANSTTSQLGQVDSLAINAAGDVFEADDNSGNVLEYSGSLGYIGVYATGLPGADYYGMAFDNSGDLFVSYEAGQTGGGIEEITPGGSVSTVINLANIGLGAYVPTGLAYDPESSNLYMTYDTFGGGNGGADYFAISSNGTLNATVNVLAAKGTLDDPYAIADATPEPGTFLMAGFGLLSIALFRFRRTSRQARQRLG